MKIVIYTANIGNYDQLREPRCIDNNVKYILFTDNKNVQVKNWQVINVNSLMLADPQRIARYYKLHPELVLPEHDISIWIDGKYECNIDDVVQFVKMNLKNSIACYKHNNGNRDCIYQEADICIRERLDDRSTINRQIDKYKSQDFPRHQGLFDTAIMIRKNNDAMKLFNALWWKEISEGSKRDQLSQMYVCWLTGIQIDKITFGGDVSYRSKYFIKHPHLNRERRH